MSGIPSTPDQVTPQWLTRVLGVPVATADVTAIGTGQTGATYRVSVTYGAPTDLPASFVVKLPAQDEAVRERVALSYRSEHAFYTELADTLAVPLPRCHHCAITGDGASKALIERWHGRARLRLRQRRRAAVQMGRRRRPRQLQRPAAAARCAQG